MKKFFAWVYHWLTVIGALAVGGATIALQAIDALTVTDFASYLPPEKSVAIMTSIAALKTACVVITAAHGLITGASDD